VLCMFQHMHGERIQVSQSNLFEAPMIILEGGPHTE